MNNFSWYKAIGFGVLVWAIMFILASVLVALGVVIGVGWSFMLALAMGVVAYFLAVNVNSTSSMQALGYGLLWVAIGLIMDLLVSRQFQADIYSMWTYWFGYVLVLSAPWVVYELQGAGAHPKAV